METLMKDSDLGMQPSGRDTLLIYDGMTYDEQTTLADLIALADKHEYPHDSVVVEYFTCSTHQIRVVGLPPDYEGIGWKP